MPSLKTKSSLTYLILFSFLFPFIGGCVRNPATRKVHARLLSAASEKRIGEETKKRILEQYEVFESSDVQAYVNRVGQKIALVGDRPSIDYDFTVLDHDLINAFAAPGGYIFVTRGLLDNITNEAELAMVLGHEIGHVAALHGVQMIQKEMGQNALYILGTIGAAIVAGPEAMLMIANTANLFSNLYLLGYSREKELEADNLGVQYMMRAGYDPQAALQFLKKLQEGDPDQSKGWDLYFKTHPNTADRISIIQRMIGTNTPNPDKLHKEEFQKIKSLLPSVDIKERGAITGQSYKNNFHQFEIRVPSNWNMGFYYQQALISFRTNDTKGEGHLQVVELSSMTTNAEALAFQFAKYSGFQFINGRNVLYPAGYGYLGRFYGSSATGQGLDLRLFVTIHYGKGYVLVCGGPIDQPESYVLDLEQIIRSFRFDYFRS